MNSNKDDYDTLGLKKGASDGEIKLAYRRLAKKYHPDLNKEDPETEKKFMKIQEAFENIQYGSTKIPIKKRNKNKSHYYHKSPEFFRSDFFNFSGKNSFFDSFFATGRNDTLERLETHVDLRENKRRKDFRTDEDLFSHFDKEIEKIIKHFFGIF